MKFSFENLRGTMKNTSIVLIAVIAAIMIAGTLAVTVTTGDAYAGIWQKNKADQSSSVATGSASHSSDGSNGVNGGDHVTGHDRACDNAGPAEHNPNCQ
jgi:hypothetical protein